MNKRTAETVSTQQKTQNAHNTPMESDKQTQAKTGRDRSTENVVDMPKTKGLWFTRFIAILALFLTVSGIAVGYKTWNDVNRKANDIRDAIQQAQHTLENVPNNKDFASLEKKAAQSLQAAQQESDTTLAEIQRLAKTTQHYAEGVDTQIASITHLQAQVQQNAAEQSPIMATWLLSETEYLIRLANHHLQLNGEPKRALKALQAADKNLLRLAMPHYLPVRQQLAQDIAALETVKTTDIVGVSLQVAGIIKKLEPLPSPIASTREEIEAENTKDSTENTRVETTESPSDNSDTPIPNDTWQRMLDELQNSLSKAVSIQKSGEPLNYLLDSEARHALYELLRIRLETLRLLALEKNDNAYHQHIQNTLSLVDEYYPPNSSQAQTLHQQLDALDQINLEPTLPDISGSLQTFTAAQHTQPPSAAEKALQEASNAESTDKEGDTP